MTIKGRYANEYYLTDFLFSSHPFSVCLCGFYLPFSVGSELDNSSSLQVLYKAERIRYLISSAPR